MERRLSTSSRSRRLLSLLNKMRGGAENMLLVSGSARMDGAVFQKDFVGPDVVTMVCENQFASLTTVTDA